MKNLEKIADELIQIADKISSGKIPEYQHNELYTIGAFDMFLFSQKEPGLLFDLIVVLCSRYGQISKEQHKGFFELLNVLSYSTKTTEMPSGLGEILMANRSEPAIKAMMEWYRLS